MDQETVDVVEAIHRQQNPDDCATAKYFIFPPGTQNGSSHGISLNSFDTPTNCFLSSSSPPPPPPKKGNQGLGADLRFYCWILFGAFLQNRVIIFPPTYRSEADEWRWTDDSYCGDRTRNLDCYFEPYSRCQVRCSLSAVSFYAYCGV